MTTRLVMPNSAMFVMGALEHLTGERDREHLQATMIQALADLAGADEVTLHLRAEDELAPVLCIDRGGEARKVDPDGKWPVAVDQLAIAERALGEQGPYTPCMCLGGDLVAYGLAGPRGLAGIVTLRFRDAASGSAWWIGGFLKIYQNHINLIEDAEVDTLTGLFNRKTFEARIARLLSLQEENGGESEAGGSRRVRRTGEYHWLAVLDIDHFKSVNDRFGHLYGDEVLILVARLMMRGFRMEDRLFRFGGEEFVIVLSPCNGAGAALVFERIRSTIEKYDFPQVGRVTASIGFTRLRGDDVASVAVGRADEALYYAKRNGRNRVCSHEHLTAAGAIAAPPTHESFATIF